MNHHLEGFECPGDQIGLRWEARLKKSYDRTTSPGLGLPAADPGTTLRVGLIWADLC